MAGGMYSRRGGETLGERAASSGVPPAPGRARHCWVHDPPGAPGTWPGLLVEWRQEVGGWQGRVVFAVPAPGGTVLTEAWLPANALAQR